MLNPKFIVQSKRTENDQSQVETKNASDHLGLEGIIVSKITGLASNTIIVLKFWLMIETIDVKSIAGQITVPETAIKNFPLHEES
jgi:hypothetical protein